MPNIDILLPKMGESVAEATIIKWLKNEGDRVEADEPIVEIATDKVDSEVPAPEAGILLKRTVNEGDVVKVGELIAQIGEEAGKAAAAPEKHAPQQKTQPANGHSQESRPAAPAARQNVPRTGPGGKFYSPLVRNIARIEGIA